ncbi:MAG: dTDP-glucose 4,6-dehydratase, partial [Kiritimatiellota bacterium]|nr:dTDP-glucose 4,6-dehydratase [Kiritimatiellota bacterium]
YAGNLENLGPVERNPRYTFVKGDIAVEADVTAVFQAHAVDAVVHFAAESHVDRSLHFGPEAFIRTNILGTQRLLDAARAHRVRRFVHVSTDEVYGSLELEGRFMETSPIQPNNPYAATKAGSDFMVRAAHRSHGLDAVITRCSNNFGPYQFPEKLIPLMIANALENKPLPVYGDGRQVRDWIYVHDHCRGIDCVLRKGKTGEVYNIGGMHDVPNLEVVRLILKLLNKPPSLIQHVTDRPGHDRRYAIDSTKIETELGWRRQFDFETALKATVDWYLQNRDWWERIRSGEYQKYYAAMYGNR